MSVSKVEVELIENPQITRTMTVESFRQNQNRWRLRNPADSSIVQGGGRPNPRVAAAAGGQLRNPLPPASLLPDDGEADDLFNSEAANSETGGDSPGAPSEEGNNPAAEQAEPASEEVVDKSSAPVKGKKSKPAKS